MPKRLTTEEFIARARRAHGDRYDYSKAEYIGSNTRVSIICPEHGEFRQTPNNHLARARSSGCPECGYELQCASRRSNTQSFVKKAKAIHGDTYDYSKVEYIDIGTKVTISCSEHGEFRQTPHSHLRGIGCAKCGFLRTADKCRGDTETFIKKAKAIHGENTYDYSKVKYARINSHVTIVCPKHGEFKQTPGKHVNSRQGCPACGKEKSIEARRYNTEIFIAKAEAIHGSTYDYSKVEYIDSDTAVIIVCPEHGEFEQDPSAHLQGGGCRACSSVTAYDLNSFLSKANEVHGEKNYDYSKVEYLGATAKVTIICPKHGEFEQQANSHLYGRGCPQCAPNRRIKSTEKFIEIACTVHGDIYDYSKVEYVSSNTKVKIICPEHGEYEQNPSDHLQGRGCPECSYSSRGIAKRSNTESFIENANAVHNHAYDYSKTEYVTSKEKVTIICPEHGEFYQSPNDHLTGYGCSKCSYSRAGIANRSNTESFIENANAVHNHAYDYSKTEYVTSKEKVTIICPEHGEFYQSPNNHLKGAGCPGCSYGGFDQTRPATLYYLRIESPTHLLWKIGITNRSVNERFENEDLEIITTLKTWHYENGADAINREKEILTTFTVDRYKGIDKPLISSGNTELFTRDVLRLDKDYD